MNVRLEGGTIQFFKGVDLSRRHYFVCGALSRHGLGTATTGNCNTVASPPPLATFGGPATARAGQTELGLAVGTFGQLSLCAPRAPQTGWCAFAAG